MGSPLPTNIDATYADDASKPDQKLHQKYHDALHSFYNGHALWQFYVEDYGATGDGVTDDSAAIQAAVDAAFAYANSSGGYYAEVVFRPVTYLIAGAYQTKYYGNAQIAIPYQPMASNKVTLVLRGAFEASAMPTWLQTNPQRSGAVLRSTGAGGAADPTNGDYCVIGGPAWQQGFGTGNPALVGPDAGSSNSWDNLMLVVDGISVVVPSPANQAGFQFQTVAEVSVGSISAYSNAAPSGNSATPYVQSSNTRAIGLIMPNDYNNANNSVRNFSCEGFYVGLLLGEHTIVENCRFLYCHTGVYVANTAHYGLVKYACIELCTIGIDHQGHADFLMADFENNSGVAGPFATQFYVNATDTGSGVVRFFTMDGNSTLINPGLLSLTDASAVRVIDGRLKQGYYDTVPSVPASGSYMLNPYFRDTWVSLSGGTVSKVEVWSPGTAATYRTVATTTGVTVFVPAGSYVKLTYTAAPTWVWCLTSAT